MPSVVFLRAPVWSRWAGLLALSLLLTVLIEALRLPAGRMLGPMLAGILFALAGAGLGVGRWPFLVAQAVVGTMIGAGIDPAIGRDLLAHGPLFAALILGVIAVSAGLGWLLARWRVLPGTVAVWGSSPGAAAAMTLMAGACGADARLVAFMQYWRVVLVVLTATLLGWSAGGTLPPPVAEDWLAPPGPAFGLTLALIAAGLLCGRWRGLPAGAMLVPLALAALLRDGFGLRPDLPALLLTLSYALIGWRIGLGFTRATLGHVARALPRVTAAILLQIALCAGLGLLLSALIGVDPLTALLATSPGGADSIAIIASTLPVDLSFVMALQTLRLIVVILVSPRLARLIARRFDPPVPPERP